MIRVEFKYVLLKKKKLSNPLLTQKQCCVHKVAQQLVVCDK